MSSLDGARRLSAREAQTGRNDGQNESKVFLPSNFWQRVSAMFRIDASTMFSEVELFYLLINN